MYTTMEICSPPPGTVSSLLRTPGSATLHLGLLKFVPSGDECASGGKYYLKKCYSLDNDITRLRPIKESHP